MWEKKDSFRNFFFKKKIWNTTNIEYHLSEGKKGTNHLLGNIKN